MKISKYIFRYIDMYGMSKKIQQLENNQKPKINSTKKIIYVFKALNIIYLNKFNYKQQIYKVIINIY